MTARAATIGGATQAVTTSADSAPMTAVPTKLPAFWRPDTFASRVSRAEGILRSNSPNIASASTTKSAANAMMIQGCWKNACACWPAAAKAAPAIV
jgi:hypothetical protein